MAPQPYVASARTWSHTSPGSAIPVGATSAQLVLIGWRGRSRRPTVPHAIGCRSTADQRRAPSAGDGGRTGL